MKARDISGLALVVFDHNKGPFLAGLQPSDKQVLADVDSSSMISLISEKAYQPGDILHETFKKSRRQVFGRIYACRSPERSDLFVFFIITTTGVQLYELKTLAKLIDDYHRGIFPQGFTSIDDGQRFLAKIAPKQLIKDEKTLNVGGKEIALREIKKIAIKYGLYETTLDILGEHL
ncbi:MAG: hypothetical protein ACFFD4_28615 [Candidatus Odinarchaeota archaeon]